VTLTGLQINGKDGPIPDSGGIQLPPGRNTLAVRFAALNPANPSRVLYRFQLAGLEKDWTEVDSTNRLARYTGVRPGDYVFRVEAALDGRSWGKSVALVGITIVPPWWRTWWAELLEALAVAGLLFSMHKIRVRAHHRRAIRLSALVDQRTAELVEASNRAQQATDEAQQARLQAESANQAKSVFLAHMSHELRNPLSSILGVSNLFREENATEQQREYLDLIDRSGEHLLNLIDDVLDVAKIEAGKQELRLAPLNAITLAHEVADVMRIKAAVKQVDLICSHATDVHPYVLADASKLRQILINLVGNAIKFTAKGRVTMRVRTTVADGANRLMLRFEVEDTGIGIPPQDRARIFDPFVQVGKHTGQKGTGLGLTISRRFVEMMGGSIAVESTPALGSRFVVEIPAEPVKPSDVKSLPPFGANWFVLQPGEPERRVLIVEDDPENAMILEQILSRAGFPLRIAATGAAGLDLFTSWHPDFVWLDVQLPDMSGLEVARAIRDMPRGRHVRIAAMTASAYESERAQALASGMDDFVRKPYRPAEIFDCMSLHLGVHFHHESGEAARKVESA
jgi:signal transduction histidine kinase/ActR/RegA family two-component response regulator